MESGENKLVKNKGAYHVFGVDVQWDNEFNPWILEVNVYPNLHVVDSKAKRNILP